MAREGKPDTDFGRMEKGLRRRGSVVEDPFVDENEMQRASTVGSRILRTANRKPSDSDALFYRLFSDKQNCFTCDTHKGSTNHYQTAAVNTPTILFHQV